MRRPALVGAHTAGQLKPPLPPRAQILIFDGDGTLGDSTETNYLILQTGLGEPPSPERLSVGRQAGHHSLVPGGPQPRLPLCPMLATAVANGQLDYADDH